MIFILAIILNMLKPLLLLLDIAGHQIKLKPILETKLQYRLLQVQPLLELKHLHLMDTAIGLLAE